MRREDSRLIGTLVDVLSDSAHGDQQHVAAVWQYLRGAITIAGTLNTSQRRAARYLREIQREDRAAAAKKGRGVDGHPHGGTHEASS